MLIPDQPMASGGYGYEYFLGFLLKEFKVSMGVIKIPNFMFLLVSMGVLRGYNQGATPWGCTPGTCGH